MSRLMFCAAFLIGALGASSAQASECAIRTGTEASLLLPASLRVSVNGRVLGAAEISTHTPSGACAGRGVWTGSATAVTIWGDDTQTADKDGFQSSEPIGFRVRDTASGVEYTGSNALITTEYEEAAAFYRTDGLYAGDAMYRVSAITVLTAPTSPTTVSPSDGASDVPTTLALTWSDVPRAEYYDVEIAANSQFTEGLSTSSQTATSLETSAPRNGETYFWRVRARNAAGASAWSSAASFTTIAAAPGAAPQLAAPGDGAADQPRDLTLAWHAADGADHYRVELSASAEFSPLTFEAAAVAGTSVDVSALAEGQQYYWRVRAVNAGGEGPWSAVFDFSTAPPPPAVPATPAIVAADVESGSVSLSWSASAEADSYLLQVATTDAFDPLAVQRSLADTNVVLTDLAPGTNHFWRVQAQNEGVSSGWSAIGRFKTRPARPSAAPGPVRPTNGSVVNSTEVTFSWAAIEGASSYRLRIYEDEGPFPQVVIDSSAVTGNELLVPLAAGKSYAWDVQATNSAGEGPWTALVHFSLSSMSVTGRNEHDGLPNSVTIHPNYPNPFNPSTTIPFDVPQAMPVRIVVYDIAGAQQAVLIDSNVAAGRHEVRWAADGFPSGTYFCRIEAGGIERTVTLLLIK